MKMTKMIDEILLIPDVGFLTETLSFHPKQWGDERIWNIIETYPPYLRRWFKQLQKALHIFINSGKIGEIHELFQIHEKFWNIFWRNLSLTEDLEASFVAAKGFMMNFGLDWCLYKIQSYYLKNHLLPSCSDNIFASIYYYTNKGVFKLHEISDWYALRHEALKNIISIPKELQKISSIEGFERAKHFISNFYKNNGRLPTIADDPQVRLIRKTIQRKKWGCFGVESWADLLYEIFQKPLSKSCWKGKKGLERAKVELWRFLKDHGIKPKYYSQINVNLSDAFRERYWKEFGINSWQDLLEWTFS